MPSLPLHHFRGVLHQFRDAPDFVAAVLAGTGLTPDTVRASDLELNSRDLWAVCDNVRNALGPGWFLQFPILWSIDVHSQVECAMRFAPRLGDALNVLPHYAHRRWTFARWRSELRGSTLQMTLTQAEPVDRENWQLFGIIASLNLLTIINVAYADAKPHLEMAMEGDPPIDREALDGLFGCPIAWNSRNFAFSLPCSVLDMPSTLADRHVFATLIDSLEVDLADVPAPFTARIVALATERDHVRMPIEVVARQLGIAVRTLERRLAAEGISYRVLTEDIIKKRLLLLIENDEVPLDVVAEQLGYSDRTALSRACRRWFGKSVAQMRREMARPAIRLTSGHGS